MAAQLLCNVLHLSSLPSATQRCCHQSSPNGAQNRPHMHTHRIAAGPSSSSSSCRKPRQVLLGMRRAACCRACCVLLCMLCACLSLALPLPCGWHHQWRSYMLPALRGAAYTPAAAGHMPMGIQAMPCICVLLAGRACGAHPREVCQALVLGQVDGARRRRGAGRGEACGCGVWLVLLAKRCCYRGWGAAAMLCSLCRCSLPRHVNQAALADT